MDFIDMKERRHRNGVYEKMVDIASGDEGMSDCYARMARIASDALKDRDKSIELWNKVIDLRGEDPMALLALAGLYEGAQMWRELVDILERTVRITEVPEDRIPLHKRLGAIWSQKLERERESLDAWQEVLQIDSRDIDALRAIAQLYRQLQQPDDLVETLHRLIEAGQLSNMSIDEIREAYAELGKLYAEQLMRPEDAIASWRKVFEYNKKDFRALAALETLFNQEARWEDAVDVIEKRVKLLEKSDEKIAELIKVGRIWEDQVADAAAAADAYERVLGIDKHNMTASVQLENIYRGRANWSQLSDLLLARVEFPTNTPHNGYRLPSASPYYQKPYSGITLIENYMTFTADATVVVELFKHLRLRLGFNYSRTQGHLVTTDDAGTTSYPSNIDRNNAANRVLPIGVVTPQTCNANRVDLSCPMDWNSAYRAVINQPGRRYRIDDINTLGGTAQLQGYW